MIEMGQISEFSRQIVKEFQPDRIILFGSYAYGIPTIDSDVDLLVIMPYQGKPFRKSLEMLNKVDPKFAVDIVVRDPDDTVRRYREGDPLIREALDKGKVLYERNN